MTDERPTGDGNPADGFTRRGVMAAAGAAGLAAVMGTAQASNQGDSTNMQQANSFEISGDRLDLGGRLIVGTPGYGTIQEAWENADDGDVVYVHSSYDAQAAGEEFPIVIDQREKEVALEGGHPSGSEINAEHQPDKNVIEVYGQGPGDYRNTPMIRNLKLVGGNVGLQVVGAPNASFAHLKFFKTNSHGAHVTITDDHDGGSHGTRWYDCEAWSCGGNGFRVDTAAKPHGATFLRCNSTWNGWNGELSGVHLRGYSSVWQSGTIQRNSNYGIDLRSGGSQVVRDTYFESNGLETDHPTQLRATGTAGLVVEGCYFQGGMYSASSLMNNVVGHDTCRRAITLHNTHGTTLRSCTYRNHSDGFVAVQGRHAADNDIHEESHHNIHGGDSFLVHDNGSRTRCNGIVCEQDLRGVEGKYPCDRGVHDGSGNGQWGPAIWDGSSWISLINGQAL